MINHQYKTYTASEIKNNLTNIFIDAEKEPVIITRRGSRPFVLMQLDQLDSDINFQESNNHPAPQQKQPVKNTHDPMDEYWNKYMSQTDSQHLTNDLNQEQDSPQNSARPQEQQDPETNREIAKTPSKKKSKGLSYYLFEKKYH